MAKKRRHLESITIFSPPRNAYIYYNPRSRHPHKKTESFYRARGGNGLQRCSTYHQILYYIYPSALAPVQTNKNTNGIERRLHLHVKHTLTVGLSKLLSSKSVEAKVDCTILDGKDRSCSHITRGGRWGARGRVGVGIGTRRISTTSTGTERSIHGAFLTHFSRDKTSEEGSPKSGEGSPTSGEGSPTSGEISPTPCTVSLPTKKQHEITNSLRAKLVYIDSWVTTPTLHVQYNSSSNMIVRQRYIVSTSSSGTSSRVPPSFFFRRKAQQRVTLQKSDKTSAIIFFYIHMLRIAVARNVTLKPTRETAVDAERAGDKTKRFWPPTVLQELISLLKKRGAV